MNPDWLTPVGSTLLFQATDTDWDTHTELYRSDGTPGGTKLVRDINPGSDSSTPEWLTNVGGQVFFAADDGSHGRELWRSDGTRAGTILFKDLVAGGSSDPTDLTAVGTGFFFTATGPKHGRELWKSDGTPDGTKAVTEIKPAAGSAFPDASGANRLVKVGTKVFFVADDGTHADEVWVSDGTATGTHIVKDINVAGSSEATDLINVAGTLYFTARDGDPAHGHELWRSDGTEAGTLPVVEEDCVGDGMLYPSGLVAAGSDFYFKAFGCETGFEIWKSDGTAVGTGVLRDINPALGGGDSTSSMSWATSAGGCTSSPTTARMAVRSGAPTGPSSERPWSPTSTPLDSVDPDGQRIHGAAMMGSALYVTPDDGTPRCRALEAGALARR